MSFEYVQVFFKNRKIWDQMVWCLWWQPGYTILPKDEDVESWSKLGVGHIKSEVFTSLFKYFLVIQHFVNLEFHFFMKFFLFLKLKRDNLLKTSKWLFTSFVILLYFHNSLFYYYKTTMWWRRISFRLSLSSKVFAS